MPLPGLPVDRRNRAALEILDLDGTMTANSDVHAPSQKAVVTYVGSHGGAAVATLGYIPAGNLRFNCTVGASALTIAVKTNDTNADPSAGDKITINFRDTTLTAGDYSAVDITAALSLTIPASQAVGTVSAKPCRLWIGAINNGGAVELAVVNCLLASAGGIFPLNEGGLISTTAIATAPSAGVFYSATARSSKAMRILGYIEYTSGLATAGTWSATPDIVKVYGVGDKKPGDIVQRVGNTTGAVSSSATTTPNDDTIPQSGEGAQVMSQAITPVSGANMLEVEHLGNYSSSGGDYVTVALHQDSAADALAAQVVVCASGTHQHPVPLSHVMQAGGVAATTFKVRAGATASTTTFNGKSGGRIYAGVMNSYLRVMEIMA